MQITGDSDCDGDYFLDLFDMILLHYVDLIIIIFQFLETFLRFFFSGGRGNIFRFLVFNFLSDGGK